MDLAEKTISEETIYEGKIIKLRKQKVVLPNGNTADREIVNHPGGVAILAFKDENTVIFVEQYRKPIDKVTLELPAGKIEKGEDIKLTALRELEEETGYKSNDITYLGKVLASPGFCDEYIHILKAENLYNGKAGCLDEDEFVNVHYHSLEEVQKMIKEGIIEDAKTICAFGYIR